MDAASEFNVAKLAQILHHFSREELKLLLSNLDVDILVTETETEIEVRSVAVDLFKLGVPKRKIALALALSSRYDAAVDFCPGVFESDDLETYRIFLNTLKQILTPVNLWEKTKFCGHLKLEVDVHNCTAKTICAALEERYPTDPVRANVIWDLLQRLSYARAAASARRAWVTACMEGPKPVDPVEVFWEWFLARAEDHYMSQDHRNLYSMLISPNVSENPFEDLKNEWKGCHLSPGDVIDTLDHLGMLFEHEIVVRKWKSLSQATEALREQERFASLMEKVLDVYRVPKHQRFVIKERGLTAKSIRGIHPSLLDGITIPRRPRVLLFQALQNLGDQH